MAQECRYKNHSHDNILKSENNVIACFLHWQIMPLDVDFGRMNFHAYPPNFTIVVNGRNAVKDSVAAFQFKGTIPVDLVYEEPLIQSTALHRSGICPYMYILLNNFLVYASFDNAYTNS